MLPIRTRSIFRSRWMALLWAGGIIWSAVEFAGDQPGAANKASITNADGETSAADQQAMTAALKALGQ